MVRKSNEIILEFVSNFRFNIFLKWLHSLGVGRFLFGRGGSSGTGMETNLGISFKVLSEIFSYLLYFSAVLLARYRIFALLQRRPQNKI